MNAQSILGVCLVSLAFAACGSSGPVSEPAGDEPTTIAPGAETLSGQLAGTWYPLAVDGVDLDAAEGDSWTFSGTEAALEITGFDGCNSFRSTDAASIVDERLENVEIGSTTQECDDVDLGPYPETGALLTVSDDGTTLTSNGLSGTVELSRNSPDQESEPSDTSPPAPPAETLADQLAGRWYPVAVDGVAIDSAEGDFWSFRGTDTALGISGYDGCNNFSTVGNPDQESATIVDGRFDVLEMGAEEAGCDEGAFSGPYPEIGALLTISDDGTILTMDGPSGTVELSRNSAAPAVSSDLPPSPDPDAGVFELSPSNPQPGTTFEATFDPGNARGGYFTLERWTGSEWLAAAFLLESDANGGSPTRASIDGEFEVLDYGASGAGPDGLVMPDVIDVGIWRLCTANARDYACAHLSVAQ